MPLLSESQCFDFNIFFLKQTLLQVTLKVSGEKNAQTGLKKKNRGEQLCMLSSQIITSHSEHSIIVWIQEVIEKPKKKRA